MGSVLNEVIGPDMVSVLRPKPHAGSIIQPEPTAFGLFGWDFQPLASPDPGHTLVVHMPALSAQQRCDPTVAIAAIAPGQIHDRRG